MAKKSTSKLSKTQVTELKKRLKFSILGIFGFIIGGILIFNFFGPQIGALFGFISVHRNDSGPQAVVTISPPSFFDVPDATKDKSVNIKGYAQSGSTVVLYLNGPEKGEVLVGGDGQFHFENIPLIEGRNTFFAKAIDEAGNKSESSEIRTILMDNKNPDIQIDEPKNGETIVNLNRRILVKGKISEKAKVTINNRLAVVKPDLTFEYLLGVSQGDVTITVKATDEAGNEKIEAINVKYKEDSN